MRKAEDVEGAKCVDILAVSARIPYQKFCGPRQHHKSATLRNAEETEKIVDARDVNQAESEDAKDVSENQVESEIAMDENGTKAEADILRRVVRIATETTARSVTMTILTVVVRETVIAATDIRKNGENATKSIQDDAKIPDLAARTETSVSAAALQLWCVTAAGAKGTSQQSAKLTQM